MHVCMHACVACVVCLLNVVMVAFADGFATRSGAVFKRRDRHGRLVAEEVFAALLLRVVVVHERHIKLREPRRFVRALCSLLAVFSFVFSLLLCISCCGRNCNDPIACSSLLKFWALLWWQAQWLPCHRC